LREREREGERREREGRRGGRVFDVESEEHTCIQHVCMQMNLKLDVSFSYIASHDRREAKA
jgi:hypothetical protein